MNTKKTFKTDWKPNHLYQVVLKRGVHDYLIRQGTLLSVIRRPGLIGGKYEFLYAERDEKGLLLHVSGPDSRVVSERHRKIIRESDIKTVHLKTVRKE